jgi:membrane fusion protein (multidrug efflux system)
MYVRAVLDDAVNTAALLAPQQSISRDASGEAIAMVVGKNNRVEQRSVITGRAIGNDWLVVSGLSSGDRLIVEGLGKVHAGDVVRPLELATGAAGSGKGPPGATAAQSDTSTLARAAGSR